jgi:YVTN family beta-propeller protein
VRWVLAGLSLTAVAATAAMVAPGRGAGEAPATKRLSVILVANSFDGTVDVISQRSFRRLERIDVAPDYRECVGNATTGDEADACVVDNQLSADGLVILLDDLQISPDDRILYVSRPSLGDVVAFNLKTERLLWRVEVSGRLPDHLALAPDGSRLLVSARGADIVEVIDTRSATIVDQFPTGVRPHGNEYSEDGKLIYNGSIGEGMAPADECGCWLTIVDTETMDVKRVLEFEQGIRPFVVMPNGNKAYIQLTHLPGFVEYSLRRARPVRSVQLPVPDETTLIDPESDPRASTHHGIALNDDRTKICAAASISDYVAIVRRRALSVKGIVPVGDEPAWATSSDDGRYCFVPNRDSDDVSVISYRKPREIARIEVGDHPKRIRTARVPVP